MDERKKEFKFTMTEQNTLLHVKTNEADFRIKATNLEGQLVKHADAAALTTGMFSNGVSGGLPT